MPGRKVDWQWRKHVARERRRLERNPSEAVCWICGNPIDMELPPLHEHAFTCDHITPIAAGGDLHGETRPAHRSCNSARSKTRRVTETNTLLDWN